MDVLSFLTAAPNLPFSISAVFLLLLLALEIVGVLVAGIGISHFGEFDHGHGADIDSHGLASDALGYLHWGKVPLIVILSALTGLFALSGLGIQSLASWLSGGLLPGWLASIPALAAAVYGTHKIALPISRLMPSEEGDATRETAFVGLIGRVTIGPCRWDAPGEALVKDLSSGREHYIRVKPAAPGVVLLVHGEILVTDITAEGGLYLATSIDEIAESTPPSSISTGKSEIENRSASRSALRQERLP